ncbi:MAG: arylesterase [Pseudomonadota bacterium]
MLRMARCLRWLPIMAASALLCPLPAAAKAQPISATLVVFGDSLSAGYGIRAEEGWVALLTRRLESEGYGYRVVNASVSGETTVGGLARIGHVLAVQRPAIVVIELGANDGLRGLPVTELRRNLVQIASLARDSGARVLLVGTRVPSNYGPAYSEDFYASFATVAREQKLALVPFLLEGIALDERNFQEDRLHPLAAAQPRLLDNVWHGLKPLLAPPARHGAPH